MKDERGRVYLPGEDIEQIVTWDVTESYRVYAESALDWEVTGADLRPDSMLVPLTQGGDFIPYLPATPQAIDQAFRLIEETLVRVEDGEGRAYEPDGSVTELDSLRPGRGYELYVSQADTLAYPIRVNTLDDALALEGLKTGQYVDVRGYREAEDGGGGLFQVAENACKADGGICFVFDEDMSAEQGPIQLSPKDLRQNYQLPHTDVIGHTVVMGIEYGGERIDNMLNKRHWPHLTEYIDWKAGQIGTGNGFNGGPWEGSIDRWFTDGQNTQDDEIYDLRYKHATTDRRLVRQGVTDSVNLKWWGAEESDPQNPVNNWWRLNYAIQNAAQLRAQKNLDWAYVDIPGEFYYKNRVTLREGVELRGTNETQISTSVDGRPIYGKLKLMPNTPGEFYPVKHLKDGHSSVENGGLGIVAVDIKVKSGASKIGLKQLELDGNIDGNQDPLVNQDDYTNDGEYDNIDNRLQNANVWNGIVGSGSGDRGSVEAHFTDLHVDNYPGNGITSGSTFDLTPSQYVRVGDAPSNHQTYHAGIGDYNNWTIEDSGWDVLFRFDQATVTDFTVQNVKEGTFWTVFGKRWSAVFDHEARNVDETSSVVDQFEVDLSGGNNRNVRIVTSSFLQENLSGGPHLTLKNGTVLSLPENSTSLFSPKTPTDSPIGGFLFDNIEFVDQGGGISLFGGEDHTNVTYKNITMRTASDVSALHSAGIGSIPWFKGSEPTPHAGRIEVSNLTVEDQIDVQPVIVGGFESGDVPYDLFITSSSLRNEEGNTPLIARFYKIGNDADKQEAVQKMREYISGSTVEVSTSGSFHRNLLEWDYSTNLDFKQRPLKLRNVTDQDGRTSEDSGTFTSGASDEGNDHVLIPTNLLSYAWETEMTLVSSPSDISSITGVDVANSDGTLRPNDDPTVKQTEPYLKVTFDGTIGSGETVEVDWIARITPLSEYQTTGLFIPRPPSEMDHIPQSFTSGNGPFTIDLRGTAASQESDEKIVYTASSGDTSVVTANVQSNDYTLELTEQSAGTATITVTGEITGVGTAETTFTVNVE
ncbi:hypothetical protein [Salinibacter sp.]|uniref:hypothetical protein n=1 Tax=Salinibacter sp. TaxID=2065818 RepID=UPI0021E7D9A0|nr:hypothetical protein [Salinibacter sp.]